MYYMMSIYTVVHILRNQFFVIFYKAQPRPDSNITKSRPDPPPQLLIF